MCLNYEKERERGGELVTRVRKINGDEHFSSASFPVLMFCTETSSNTHTHTHTHTSISPAEQTHTTFRINHTAQNALTQKHTNADE